MALIKYFDKRVGITYVYDSESYYDAEKHQSRSKRRLIGKIDPETGEIVPTGKKGRPARNPPAPTECGNLDYKAMYEKLLLEISAKNDRISQLEQQLQDSRRSEADYRDTIEKISGLCSLRR